MKKLPAEAQGFIKGITQYIEQEGKTSVLPKVRHLFGKISQESERETVAKVVSAVPLTVTEKEHIARMLYTYVGHAVTLNCTVDARLIAGLRIQIWDWVLDTSFKGQLEQLSHDILHV